MRPPALATQQGKKRQTARGFTLIELLIVVAIILIIAAIAIPNFMRSRMAANEAGAVSSCRNIVTAQVVYSTTYSRGYSQLLSDLKPPPGGGMPNATNAGLLDDVLTRGTKHGYQFFYTPIDVDGDGQPEAFTIVANPVVMGSSGSRGFYTDQTGVVRQKNNGVAGPADPPIG
ncbi:MAG: prepilin-type N-terminal cleavage/methylation domain-containing protein [Terriglobales bacterium]